MDALKALGVGDKYELDESYGPIMPQKAKLDELHEWACQYMNETKGRPQFSFQYDKKTKRYTVERVR